MRKRLLISCLLALSLVSGCRKSGGSPIPDANAPVPVMLGYSFVDIVQTRSQGALDEGWNGQDLFLYGVERRELAEGESFDKLFLFEKQDQGHGSKKYWPLRVNAPDVNVTATLELTNTAGEHFFYESNTRYDFFGYSVDDAVLSTPQPDPERERALKSTLTINGRQDILMAKADRQADCERVNGIMPDGEDRVNPEDAYSPASARRDVHPHLNFKHMLSRFKIRVQSSGKHQNEFELLGIAIESKTKAEMLLVYGDDLSSYDALVPQPGTEGWLSPVAVPSIDDPDSFADIMVMPGSQVYKVRLTVRQEGFQEPFDMYIDMDLAKYLTDNVRLPAEEGDVPYTAEPGIIYRTLLSINGREKVDVTVTMEEWNPGYGSFNLDQDELDRLEQNGD